MPGVDLAALGTAMTVIIGLVNGVSLALDTQQNLKYTSFLKFLFALILGIVFGLLHWFGLSVELGIVAALASSGLYKVASKVGGA